MTMEKVYKATMKAFGARTNGSDRTSCVNDAHFVKQFIMVVSLAFTVGALSFGFRGLPDRVKSVEAKVLRIEVIAESIDSRLGRIEGAILGGKRR